MNAPIHLMLADGAAANFSQRVRELADPRKFSLIVPDLDTEAALLSCAPEAQAIVSYKAQVPASVIRAAPSLRLIQKHGLNCRNIDLDAAAERKIPVATLPLFRNVTVAEHALALMLACARKVIPAHRAVTQAVYEEMGLEPAPTSERNYSANWAKIKGVTELLQTTVGIVGMGDIGMEIAKRCHAFDMTIVYHQRAAHPRAVEESLGVRSVPFDELLSISDFIVLAIPHTPQTEGLIGTQQLARMKPSVTLINIGRGGLIDEDALVAALQSKPGMMAGLDVYRNEPLPSTSELLALPNVVLTPHNGGGSYRSRDVDMPAVLRSVERFFGGQ